MDWIVLLKEEVRKKGVRQVAKELGKSPTAVHLVLNGKYGASTNAIEKLVNGIYGGDGIQCPVLGDIKPDRCADSYGKAKKIGLGVGNPETLRLHYACLNCEIRG